MNEAGPRKVHQDADPKMHKIFRFLSKRFWPIFVRNSDHASDRHTEFPNLGLHLQKIVFFFRVSRATGLSTMSTSVGRQFTTVVGNLSKL